MAHARIITVMEDQPQLVAKYSRRRGYVINELLPSLAPLGLQSTEIFPAATPSALDGHAFTYHEGPSPTVEHHDAILKVREPWSVGCFLSSFCLWRLCVAMDSTVLILEDDAVLPPEHAGAVREALAAYESAPDDGGILYLLSQSPSYVRQMKVYHPSELQGCPIPHLSRLGHVAEDRKSVV